jgi:hypothetical protein
LWLTFAADLRNKNPLQFQRSFSAAFFMIFAAEKQSLAPWA